MINYFNFEKRGQKYLITNDFGKYQFISENTFKELISDSVKDGNVEKSKLIENGFIYETSTEGFVKNNIPLLHSMKGYCMQGTALHIFAVTNKCNLDCVYCQAHSKTSKLDNSMSTTIGKKAIDFSLQSPNKHLTFEFQGGEPLLNFDVIKEMINYSKKVKNDKEIEYTIVSNLIDMDDEKLQFLIDNDVHICTSLDGPKEVHNSNRPCRNGSGSYDIVIEKIKKYKNFGININAIQTTTNISLKYPKEIINQYLSIGINNIFLRPLTPLGMADASWKKVGYSAEEFMIFYKKAFDYIMQLNLKGTYFSELHAAYFLKKILCNYSDNYMELRSPCGASVGQMSYYYNGNVYTCDEGRMLFEMGDNSFFLGNVLKDSYKDAITSSVCSAVCKASIIESLPKCAQCVYQPYCGVCPVVNYAATNNLYYKNKKDFRCYVYRGIMDIIFQILEENDEQKINVLKSWIN